METPGMNFQFREAPRQAGTPSTSAVLRFIGHFFSFIFHPLFIPGYIAAFLVYRYPYAFSDLRDDRKLVTVLSVVFSTAFLPAFSIFLCRKLGFVSSVYLRTRRDRIIPYIICMTYYFWIWYVAHNMRWGPEMISMLLGTFIASIAAMMANIYFKISMHGIAAGALLVFFLWLSFNGSFSMGSWLSIATLVAGAMCTARFIVSDHSPFELYTGLVAGAACQLVAIGIAG
jgi:hypothetical protein